MIDGILVTKHIAGGALQLNKTLHSYLEFQAS